MGWVDPKLTERVGISSYNPGGWRFASCCHGGRAGNTSCAPLTQTDCILDYNSHYCSLSACGLLEECLFGHFDHIVVKGKLRNSNLGYSFSGCHLGNFSFLHVSTQFHSEFKVYLVPCSLGEEVCLQQGVMIMQVANLSAEMLPRWEPMWQKLVNRSEDFVWFVIACMWEFHDLFGLADLYLCYLFTNKVFWNQVVLSNSRWMKVFWWQIFQRLSVYEALLQFFGWLDASFPEAWRVHKWQRFFMSRALWSSHSLMGVMLGNQGPPLTLEEIQQWCLVDVGWWGPGMNAMMQQKNRRGSGRWGGHHHHYHHISSSRLSSW